MATTSECKKFLVEYLASNPHNVGSLFRDPFPEISMPDVFVAKNWKRMYKRKVDNMIERGFDCDGYEGQIAFSIFEDANGVLLFGEYIGD